MTESEAKVGKDIEEHGWHVIKVQSKDSKPSFAYSIGLFQSFGHPEILIVGLAPDTMHRMINNIGSDVTQGKAYHDGDVSGEILDGYECIFREVLSEHYRELFGWAIWHYKGTEFRTLQCIWPDRNHRFPWEIECESGIREYQQTFCRSV